MFEASLDISEFKSCVAETHQAIEFAKLKAVANAAHEGAEYAKAVGPFKDRTGNLRSGIVARFLNSGESVVWEILSQMPYSKFVESGTAPHDIYPKASHGMSGPLRRGQSRRGSEPRRVYRDAAGNRQMGGGHALRWVSGGVVHYAPMVHHPGSRAYPFAGPAFLKAQAVLEREFELLFGVVARIWN